MLQKGIVEQVINKYKLKVRVPKYDKIAAVADATKTEDLAECIIGTLPGVNVVYMKGDVVLVTYENNELARPVVIGLLYRDVDTSGQLNIPSVESSIKSIENRLDTIDNSGINVYVRYSNDRGMSFTSLFNKDTATEYTDGVKTYYEGKVLLTKNSNTVYWDITDNFINVTENYQIETTLSSLDGSEVYTSNESLIEVPLNFKGLDVIYLSYKILKSKGLDDCNISLSTDTIQLGTIEGKYVGICVTNSSSAPANVSSYSWLLSSESSGTIIDKLSELISIDGNIIKVDGAIDAGISYTTVAPSAPNPYGIKICVLKTLPSIQYDGWLYLIEDGDSPVPPGPTPVPGGLFYIVQNEDGATGNSSSTSSENGLYYVVKEEE